MVSGKRASLRGVSLMVELLLGLALVSMTIMAVFSVFPTADRSVALADRTTQANSIARTLLEQRLELEYSELSTDPASYEEGDIPLVHTKRHGSDLSTTFHYRIEITQPEASHEVKEIAVYVSWPRGSNDEREERVVMQASKGQMW